MMAGEFVIDTPQKLKRKLEMVLLFSLFIEVSVMTTAFHYLYIPKMIWLNNEQNKKLYCI